VDVKKLYLNTSRSLAVGVIDFGMSIVLHTSVQHREKSPQTQNHRMKLKNRFSPWPINSIEVLKICARDLFHFPTWDEVEECLGAPPSVLCLLTFFTLTVHPVTCYAGLDQRRSPKA